MSLVIGLDDAAAAEPALVGGKGAALAALAVRGFTIPVTLCLTTRAYQIFVDTAGLRSVIRQELGRKSFNDMRWEELWDTALRIRSRFLRAPVPSEIEDELAHRLVVDLADRPLAVRSSAPGEDAEGASFAGLHDSLIGVRGMAAVVDAVRSVWASLWTDRALLYRHELGIDPDTSAMAVVIQELVVGEASGVAFGVHPTDPGLMVVEAVHGLNQGLVDGTVEPDRWLVERASRRVVEHTSPATRTRLHLEAGEQRVERVADGTVPLNDAMLVEVVDLVDRLGGLFGAPQDVEWTVSGDSLTLLQSRPVTTGGDVDGDRRSWYLSLTRSLDSIRELRRRVEDEMLPAMAVDADAARAVDLGALGDHELAAEIERRRTVYDRWVDRYWQEFIPLAHGVRLFGQFYNEVTRPTDPFEFMNLLAATPMLGLRRNRELEGLADAIRRDPGLRSSLESGDLDDADFSARLDAFVDEFGDAVYADRSCFADRFKLTRLLLSMADAAPAREANRDQDVGRLTEAFIAEVPPERRSLARDILELGRAAYRLRDDDNLYLGRLEGLVLAAVNEGRRRVYRPAHVPTFPTDPDQVVRALRHPNLVVEAVPAAATIATTSGVRARPRQLVGQPAGPGVATGRARVVSGVDDLFDVRSGDVLVCDAIDPNMTFVVPLASAVVERRGGMLIHGAIIAREYGLPCVTGVPDITAQVRDGDRLTVDGYLGIVTVVTQRDDDPGEVPGPAGQ
jgi:pyruvate,water dikinase